MVMLFSILATWFLLSIPFSIMVGTAIRRCEEIETQIRNRPRLKPVRELIPA